MLSQGLKTNQSSDVLGDATRMSLGSGILRPNRGKDAISGFLRGSILQLDPLDLLSQSVILDDLADPSRVIVAAKMIGPGFVVHSSCNANERIEIVRRELKPSFRAAKQKAGVSHIALSVFPNMPLVLCLSWLNRNDEWLAGSLSKPDEDLPPI